MQDAYLRAENNFGVTFTQFEESFSSSFFRCHAGSKESEGQVEKAAVEALERIQAEDLCLAIACSRGMDSAWIAFVKRFDIFLLNVARHFCADKGEARDLSQSVYAELYGIRVTSAGRQSKLNHYSGRGSLKGWLRAVVYRMWVDRHRQNSRLVQPDEDSYFEHLIPPVANAYDVEREQLGHSYRVAIERAIFSSVSSLRDRDKLILVYYYYDDLTLREIASLLDVHEATVSRKLKKIQKQIRVAFERRLLADFHFSRSEVKECLRLAGTAVDVDLHAFLVDAGARGSNGQ